MQALLHDWYRRNGADVPSESAAPDRRFLDQVSIDWFHEMNRALNDALDDAGFAQRIRDNVARMRWLAAEMLQRAHAMHPGIGDHGLATLLDAAAATRAAGSDAAAVGDGRSASLSPQWYDIEAMPAQSAQPVLADD